MQLLNFVIETIERVAPITPTDKTHMQSKASVDYDREVKTASDKKELGEDLNIKDKFFLFIDGGYGRMLLAILFPFVCNFLTRMLDPGDPHPDDVEADETR
ncbi:hypothetical protein [Mucilaginibacter sp.]